MLQRASSPAPKRRPQPADRNEREVIAVLMGDGNEQRKFRIVPRKDENAKSAEICRPYRPPAAGKLQNRLGARQSARPVAGEPIRRGGGKLEKEKTRLLRRAPPPLRRIHRRRVGLACG